MIAGSPPEVKGLLLELGALLQRVYDLGRVDAIRELRDALAILEAEAKPAVAHVQEQVPTPVPPPRRGPTERAQVRKRGRPDVMTDERGAAAAALLSEGRLSPRTLAMEVGVSHTRFYRWMRERERTE